MGPSRDPTERLLSFFSSYGAMLEIALLSCAQWLVLVVSLSSYPWTANSDLLRFVLLKETIDLQNLCAPTISRDVRNLTLLWDKDIILSNSKGEAPFRIGHYRHSTPESLDNSLAPILPRIYF
jgi:hypothetical protein